MRITSTEIFGRGHAIWIDSIRNLISFFSTRIYSVGLCSAGIHSIRIYSTGDLSFMDQFYRNLSYKGSQKPFILWESGL